MRAPEPGSSFAHPGFARNGRGQRPTFAPHYNSVRSALHLAFVLCCFVMGACKKEEGPGGLAQIRGTILRQDINNNTGQPIGTAYPYPETNVYVRYGDHDYFDDKTDTNPNGLFTFNWLRTGNYTIFVYTECPSCPSGKKEVSQGVTISGREDVVTVPTMTVDNW